MQCIEKILRFNDVKPLAWEPHGYWLAEQSFLAKLQLNINN